MATEPQLRAPIGGTTYRTVALPVGFMEDLSSAETLNAVMEVAARWLPQAVPADRHGIALVDAAGDELVWSSLRGNGPKKIGDAVPVDGSIPGIAYTSGQPFNLPDVSTSTLHGAEGLIRAGLRSVLCAPLISAGHRFGTLNLASRNTHHFTPELELSLETFGRIVGWQLHIYDRVLEQRRLAETDELTGLRNRRALIDGMDQLVSAGPVTILFLDLDGFKEVNDAYGHSAGDIVLIETARRLQALAGPRDVIGRLGGDEFLLVRPDPQEHEVRQLADALIAALSQPLSIGMAEVSIAASVGLAGTTPSVSTAASLLVEADLAMYEAKRSSDAVVEASDRIRDRATLAFAVDRHLEEAMTRDLMTFHFQPVRDLRTGEILGAEALLRWELPGHGLIPPPVVLERLDATGLLNRFTQWGLDHACRLWATVRQSVPAFSDKAFSFNVTARQLAWGDYARIHTEAIGAHGLRPEDVIVELVESGNVAHGSPADRTLQKLAEAKAIIALDDFGTGHHALGYFTRYPIAAIKFDRSLVAELPSNPSAGIVVSGLAHVAQQLGIVCLGEGIESAAEMSACVNLGVTQGQGWHLGRPMPIDRFIDMAAAEFALGRATHDPSRATDTSRATDPSRAADTSPLSSGSLTSDSLHRWTAANVLGGP